jgi:phosphatidate cytidylyltransferase
MNFCNLIQINNVFPIVFELYCILLTLISHYSTLTTDAINQTFNTDVEIAINIQQLNVVLLVITLVIHKCILFLFYDSIQKIAPRQIPLFIGLYHTTICIYYKISFGINDYNQRS